MRESTYKTAACSVLAAMAVALNFCGSFIPFGTYAVPAFASLAVMVAVVEYGPPRAFLTYGVIALLSVLLSADKEAALLFIVFFGYYPILKALLERRLSRTVAYMLKFLCFNVAVGGFYIVMVYVLLSPSFINDFAEFTLPMLIAFIVGANLVFVLLDVMLTKLSFAYWNGLRRKFIP